jgi:hypothetical protein
MRAGIVLLAAVLLLCCGMTCGPQPQPEVVRIDQPILIPADLPSAVQFCFEDHWPEPACVELRTLRMVARDLQRAD